MTNEPYFFPYMFAALLLGLGAWFLAVWVTKRARPEIWEREDVPVAVETKVIKGELTELEDIRPAKPVLVPHIDFGKMGTREVTPDDVKDLKKDGYTIIYKERGKE